MRLQIIRRCRGRDLLFFDKKIPLSPRTIKKLGIFVFMLLYLYMSTADHTTLPPVGSENDGGLDIIREAEVLRSRTPPYQSPKDIRAWKAVDVYLWLESPSEVKTLLGIFSKPFAVARIGGFDLIRIVQEDDIFLGNIVVSRFYTIFCSRSSDISLVPIRITTLLNLSHLLMRNDFVKPLKTNIVILKS